MSRSPAITLALTVLMCGACGSGSSASSASSTVTVTTTVTVSALSTESTAATTPDATSTTEDPPPGTEATSAVVPQSRRDQELALNDFFGPNQSWSENRFDIGSAKQVRGLANSSLTCNGESSPSLELRLGNNFTELGFSAGQGNASLASDYSLVIEVLANNRQVEIRSIPFNKISSFKIPVTDVNALIIKVYEEAPSGKTCWSGQITAVLTGVRLS